MGIKLFLNDYYDLLKFMHDNEVVILDEKVIPLTQQEIATTLKCSKMKKERKEVQLLYSLSDKFC